MRRTMSGFVSTWLAARFTDQARDEYGNPIFAFQFAIDIAWGKIQPGDLDYPHSLRIPLSPVIPAREYWTRFDGGSRAGRYRR